MGVRVREKVKGSGVWWVFINHNGRRKAKKIGDKALAQRVAKQIEARLVLKQFDIEGDENRSPLLQDYAALWLETYVRPLRRPATFERYTEVFNRYIKPQLGNVPVTEIRRADVRNLFLHYNSRGFSRSAICLIRDVLSGIMNFALDEELIPANPVTGVSKRLNLERDKRITISPMTHEEVAHFLNTCQQFYPEHYPFFLCAFRTGMRLGELLGLQWGDIDWYGKFIEVKRAHRRGVTGKTKTGRTRRVDMSDQLIATLKDLYARRRKEGFKAGLGAPVPWIFHRNGKPIEQNYIRRVFKRVLQRAGLRDMRFHDIRHTYASLLLSAGESPAYVKEQLGHANIQTTVDIYGHYIPNSNRQAVNKLDDQGKKVGVRTQPNATYTQPTEPLSV